MFRMLVAFLADVSMKTIPFSSAKDIPSSVSTTLWSSKSALFPATTKSIKFNQIHSIKVITKGYNHIGIPPPLKLLHPALSSIEWILWGLGNENEIIGKQEIRIQLKKKLYLWHRKQQSLLQLLYNTLVLRIDTSLVLHNNIHSMRSPFVQYEPAVSQISNFTVASSRVTVCVRNAAIKIRSYKALFSLKLYLQLWAPENQRIHPLQTLLRYNFSLLKIKSEISEKIFYLFPHLLQHLPVIQV